MTGRWTVAVLAIVLLSRASARGQAKTDVVTLGNGDRITGEIEKVSRGHLELSTDDAGTIEFEWSKIATAESIRQFEVITSDGRHLFGSLGRSTASQFVRIVSTGVDESLPVSDVTELTPIGAGFWAKLDGSVDAGFSYTRSSGIAQTTFNSNTVFRRPSSTFRLTTSATLTQSRDDSERDDRGTLDMSWMRYRGPRWFVVGAGRLETNESLGLVLRSEIGGGVGLRLVNTNRAQFAVNGGLVVNDEIGVDTPETQNLEALFDMRTSFYSYDRPKTNLDVDFKYYPSLSDWGRQRLQFDCSLKRELWKDFFVGLNLFDTFDSAPPNPSAVRNDFGIVASVGWSY